MAFVVEILDAARSAISSVADNKGVSKVEGLQMVIQPKAVRPGSLGDPATNRRLRRALHPNAL